MESKKTYSVDETATILGVSRPTAYGLTKVEGFPVIRIGRRIRVPVEGLNRWLAENEGRQVLD